jgi:hypothetical protein
VAGLELRELLQARLDKSLLSRDQGTRAGRGGEAAAADDRKRSVRQGWRATRVRELQAKLDESQLSRDHALDQAQSDSAVQNASFAAEAK